MKNSVNTVENLLAGLGNCVPLELLSRLDIEHYLDQLESTAPLLPDERQRLGELLRAAVHVTVRQLDEAHFEQRRDARQLGELPTDKTVLTPGERDVILKFDRRQPSAVTGSGKFPLGNILVAIGQITRAQLESALLRQGATGRRLGEELITAGHADKGQIEGGLSLQRKLVTWALAVTVGIAPLATLAPPVAAAQKSAAIQVSVTVVPNARMHTHHQTQQFTISAADVSRGHVEIPAASRFSVRSNSPAGYRIDFHPLGDFFESAHVAGLGNVVRLGADGGSIAQRGPLPPDLTHELSFRFTLRPGTLPGLYPWPLLLSVRTL